MAQIIGNNTVTPNALTADLKATQLQVDSTGALIVTSGGGGGVSEVFKDNLENESFATTAIDGDNNANARFLLVGSEDINNGDMRALQNNGGLLMTQEQNSATIATTLEQMANVGNVKPNQKYVAFGITTANRNSAVDAAVNAINSGGASRILTFELLPENATYTSWYICAIWC